MAGALAAVLLTGCGGTEPAQPPPAAQATSQPGSPGPLAPPAVPLASLPKIDGAAILQRTTVMSSDKLQGRAPGTIGEEITVGYL